MIATWSRRRQIVLLMSVLAPVLLAIALLQHYRLGRRRLRFERYHIDMGVVDFGARAKLNFPVRNMSSREVEIRKVVADCSCAYAEADKRVLLPGESGTIEVGFQAAHQRGPVAHDVFVLTDMPSQEKIRLTITGIVDPKVEAIPHIVSFGHITDPRNSPVREVVVVSRLQASILTATVTSLNPFIKATFHRNEAMQSPEVGKVRIRLLPGSPVKTLCGVVTISVETKNETASCSLKVLAQVDLPGSDHVSKQKPRDPSWSIGIANMSS